MRKPRIVMTDTGFAIVTAEATDALSYDEVRVIVACTRDDLTTDLLCCDIVTGAGDGRETRTIHEDLPGFDAVMKALEALPGFNRQWRDAVVLPPFAANRTVVYDRAEHA